MSSKSVFSSQVRPQQEYTETEKPDLLDVYFFRDLVKNRFFRPATNVIFSVVLLIIIYFGLLSEHDLRFQGGIPFATIMIWDIWHPLLVFTVILLGRLWCFACPIGAAGDWTQSISSFDKKYRNLLVIIVPVLIIGAIIYLSRLDLSPLQTAASRTVILLVALPVVAGAISDKRRKYPEKYRNLWIAVILFLFVFAAERHLFMFTRDPPHTAYLLISFTALAVLMGAVFEKRSFCRYICPIGLVIGVFSMLSAIELRCKSKKTCHDHHIKECVIGNREGKACPVNEFPQTMERNNHCIMCMECAKSCSKDNIRISPRLPGADIVKSRKTYPDEAYLVHGIIIIFLFVMGMERLQFRNVIIGFVRSTAPFDTFTYYNFFVNYWRNMWAIIIFALITLGAVGLMYLSTRAAFSGENTKQKFTDLSYAFIPLSLSVYLAENTFRLLKGLFFIAEAIGGFFGRVWEFAINFETINQLQIILLASGFIFTVWTGYVVSRRISYSKKDLQQGVIVVGSIATVYLLIGMRILTLPII